MVPSALLIKSLTLLVNLPLVNWIVPMVLDIFYARLPLIGFWQMALDLIIL